MHDLDTLKYLNSQEYKKYNRKLSTHLKNFAVKYEYFLIFIFFLLILIILGAMQ